MVLESRSSLNYRETRTQSGEHLNLDWDDVKSVLVFVDPEIELAGPPLALPPLCPLDSELMTLPAVVVAGAGVGVEAFEGMAHPGPGLCPITDEADVEADKAGLADEVLRLTGDFPLALLIEVPLLRPKHTQKNQKG